MDRFLFLMAGLIFAGAIAYLIIDAIRRRRDTVKERLDRYAEGAAAAPAAVERRVSRLGEQLDRALERRGAAANIRAQLASANLKLTAGEFLALTVICVISAAALAHLWKHNVIVTLVAAILAFFAPRWYVSYLQGKRLKEFNGQLADTINLLVNSIRSGYSVLQAMEAVGREMPPPVSEEFARVVKEVQLGLPLEQALDNMLRRVPSEDLDLMITAINVQREVGGNLAEVLDAINFTIRERVRIKGEIRALTAQGRASGYLISFLPVALSGFIYLVNPTFIETLINDPCGWIMIGIAVLGIVLGFLIIRKIVDIEI
jgi:tight adherence protein B